jgi:hypothetical protein
MSMIWRDPSGTFLKLRAPNPSRSPSRRWKRREQAKAGVAEDAGRLHTFATHSARPKPSLGRNPSDGGRCHRGRERPLLAKKELYL